MEAISSVADITARELKIIQKLLEKYLPDTVAWVYGSRAKSTATSKSDLDLVIFATSEQQQQVGNLREAFEESDLPFRVDLFVWDDLPEAFKVQIEKEALLLC